MKPVILVVGEDGYFADTRHFVINHDYGRAVAEAGGLPLLAMDVRHPEDLPDLADGLFLTGGPDIHCRYYGGIYPDPANYPPLSRTRDDLDFALCRLFLQAGKPVFGVGRGMQVLNVALGGTLYQDIARETGSPHPDAGAAGMKNDAVTAKAQFAFHTVTVKENTALSRILNREETVNSCHHQAVKTLGSGLIASAAAPDGIMEAIEHTTMPWFGVQWHPERAAGELPADPRLFSAFVELCREVRK